MNTLTKVALGLGAAVGAYALYSYATEKKAQAYVPAVMPPPPPRATPAYVPPPTPAYVPPPPPPQRPPPERPVYQYEDPGGEIIYGPGYVEEE